MKLNLTLKILAATAALLAATGSANADPSPLPVPTNTGALFDKVEPLELTLRGPFKRIDQERDKSQIYRGTVVHGEDNFAVKYTARGNFRLQPETCRHAPLWLDFKKGELKDSVFDGQNKLKLVVQCKDSAPFQDFLAAEEQAYRLFALFSPVSLRTRRAWISYEDTETGETRRQLAFLIQHHKRLAKALDMNVVRDNRVPKNRLEPVQSNRVALFNFLIANTDFSVLASPGEGACCHNTKALESADEAIYPIPYDFDQTGYVNASYARVSAGLGQKTVRDRVYRGFCVEDAIVQSNVAFLLTLKDAMLSIAADDDLVSSGKAMRTARQLRRGFALLEDPGKLDKTVLSQCR